MRFKRPTQRRIGVFYLLFVSLKNDAVDFGVHPRSTLEVCVGVRVGGRFIDSQFSGNKGLRYLHHPGWECLMPARSFNSERERKAVKLREHGDAFL